MKLLAKLAALLIVLTAAPAFAGQTVTLRSQVAAEGPVTLGDIFEGAGSAAAVVAGPAPRSGGNVVLDAGQIQRLAMLNGLTWSNERGVRRIIVQPGAATATVATVTPTSNQAASSSPARGVEVLTYSRSLSAGDIVQPEDLTWETVAAAPRGAPDDADQLIGLSVRRPLRAGAVAKTSDVTAPVVIRRDDMVSVTYDSGGVRLTLQGKASESASLGETVEIENLQSGTTIHAVASGPGRAVVGPQAEALQRLAITDPSRLALR